MGENCCRIVDGLSTEETQGGCFVALPGQKDKRRKSKNYFLSEKEGYEEGDEEGGCLVSLTGQKETKSNSKSFPSEEETEKRNDKSCCCGYETQCRHQDCEKIQT